MRYIRENSAQNAALKTFRHILYWRRLYFDQCVLLLTRIFHKIYVFALHLLKMLGFTQNVIGLMYPKHFLEQPTVIKICRHLTKYL